MKNDPVLNQYFKSVVQLFLLKGSPENLPYWRVGLLTLILLHVGIRWHALQSLPQATDYPIFWIAVSGVLLHIGLLYVILRLKRVSERWLKVTLALLSVEALFIAMLKLSVSIAMVLSPFLVSVCIYGMLIWGFIVKAYVIKQGLNTRLILGVLLIILLETVSNLPASGITIDLINEMKIEAS